MGPASLSPCPHCRGLTVVEPHGFLLYRCAACGSARIPDGVQVQRSGRELAPLRAAKDAHAAAFGWRAAGIALTVIAVMTVVLGGLLALFATIPGLVIASVGLLSLVLGLSLFSRARAKDAIARKNLVEGWSFAAEDILAGLGQEVTAAQLGHAMRTSEAHAEEVLKHLSVHDRAGMRVGDDAQIYYGKRDLVPTHARVAESPEAVEIPAEEPEGSAARRGA